MPVDSKILVIDQDNVEINRIARRDAKFLMDSKAAEVVGLEPLVLRMTRPATPTEIVKIKPAPAIVAGGRVVTPVYDDDEGSLVLSKLSKDLKAAAQTLTNREARYLVDTYYQMQDNRLRADGQVRSMEKDHEPHQTLTFFGMQASTMEEQIKAALDIYSQSTPTGRWSRSILGIGPVLAAGLMAHIDIEEAPTVGHIWSFAGLNPNQRWQGGDAVRTWIKENTKGGKIDPEFVVRAAMNWGRNPKLLMEQVTHDPITGEERGLTVANLAATLARRPWNASLKVVCWKIGESFVKVKSRPNDYYGKIYAERKVHEQLKNENGDYAEQAAKLLASKNFGADTRARAAYEQGMLPDGHIHARAKRYAVKLFLAHWHEVAYRDHYGTEPPAPYPIAFLGHAHKIEVPNLRNAA
jgi:hypothetical protein